MTTSTDEFYELAREAFGPLILPYAYVPWEPTAKQEWFLRRNELEVFFGGSAGPGKLLDCQTRVPTPLGWTTIGELRIGDEVFGEDGNAYGVEWLSDIDLRPESYRLTFDDGSTIDACSDHLWLTYDAKELGALTRRDPAWRAQRRAKRPSRAVAVSQKPWVSVSVTERNRLKPTRSLAAPTGTVRTTREIATTLLVRGTRRNHAIQVAESLQLPASDVPLDPYTLGVWLGDGNSNGGHLTLADRELVAEIVERGWKVRRVPSTPYGWRIEGLTALLRQIGLLDNKHVPAVYFRGSIEQRLALLQGLMDTDGSCDRDGSAVFTNTKECLSRAVYELACSLGQKPRIKEGRARLNGRDCGPKWTVVWTPTMPTFRLPRKLVRQSAQTRRTNRFRYIVGCERIAPKPMRCVRVSNPSSLFLVGDSMIPTHNSIGLLMAALQYVFVPGYDALMLRPTLAEFEQPGGLIDISQQWLSQTDAWWNGNKRQWSFPSGATLRFGYLSSPVDIRQYKGAAYSFVGFDELTGFQENSYRAMFRVLRQAKNALPNVPLRMRSASNPGDVPGSPGGHAWVKSRFIDPRTRADDAVFVPAKITDNPHLDYEAYLLSLSHLPPLDRQRLIDGDWDVSEEGGKFHREDFEVIDEHEMTKAVRSVRYWDLAGSAVSAAYPDPDYTVGLRYDVDAQGLFTIRHIVRGRWSDKDVEKQVQQTAVEDGRGIPVYVEQDPGQAGKSQLSHYKRDVLAGFACHAGLTKIAGKHASKEVRARPVAAAVANGLVRIVRTENMQAFLDEVTLFPFGGHDDTVDALSGAHNALTSKTPGGVARSSVPRRQIRGIDPRTGMTDIRPRGAPF